MVGFQEVVEIWGVCWFGRCLRRGWQEFLFGKVAKGRLKMGFRRPFLGRQDMLGTDYDLPVVKSIYLRLNCQFLLTLPIFLKLLFCFRLIKN